MCLTNVKYICTYQFNIINVFELDHRRSRYHDLIAIKEHDCDLALRPAVEDRRTDEKIQLLSYFNVMSMSRIIIMPLKER